MGKWRKLKDDHYIYRSDDGEYSHYNEKNDLSSSLHREDGPAVYLKNRYFIYYVNGKQHREDGYSYLHIIDHFYYKAKYSLQDVYFSKQNYMLAML